MVLIVVLSRKCLSRVTSPSTLPKYVTQSDNIWKIALMISMACITRQVKQVYSPRYLCLVNCYSWHVIPPGRLSFYVKLVLKVSFHVMWLLSCRATGMRFSYLVTLVAWLDHCSYWKQEKTRASISEIMTLFTRKSSLIMRSQRGKVLWRLFLAPLNGWTFRKSVTKWLQAVPKSYCTIMCCAPREECSAKVERLMRTLINASTMKPRIALTVCIKISITLNCIQSTFSVLILQRFLILIAITHPETSSRSFRWKEVFKSLSAIMTCVKTLTNILS